MDLRVHNVQNLHTQEQHCSHKRSQTGSGARVPLTLSKKGRDVEWHTHFLCAFAFPGMGLSKMAKKKPFFIWQKETLLCRSVELHFAELAYNISQFFASKDRADRGRHEIRTLRHRGACACPICSGRWGLLCLIDVPRSSPHSARPPDTRPTHLLQNKGFLFSSRGPGVPSRLRFMLRAIASCRQHSHFHFVRLAFVFVVKYICMSSLKMRRRVVWQVTCPLRSTFRAWADFLNPHFSPRPILFQAGPFDFFKKVSFVAQANVQHEREGASECSTCDVLEENGL